MIEQAYDFLLTSLRGNEFFQGGFVLALMGTAAMWGRQLPAKTWALIKRLLIVECDIQQRDDAFRAMVDWLAEHPYGRRVKRFTASVVDGSGVQLSPAPGVHWIRYAGNIIRIERGREKQKQDDAFFGFYESFTLQTFGRGRGTLERLIREAVAAREARTRDRTRVLIHDGYGNWDEAAVPAQRPLDSVILDQQVKERVVADLEEFFGSQDWYREMGIPYRRGVLLHGPPGTGKSSFCLALAAHFDLSVAVLSLSDSSMTDEKLARQISRAPRGAVLLLEDLDCLYDENRTRKEEVSKVTMSGLLNVLDGAVAQEGRVVFMTTNHPDRIDPALRRPGRADVVESLAFATEHQARELFIRFFPNADKETYSRFAQRAGGRKHSPAKIQQHLMRHRHDPKAAVETW